MPKIVFVHDSEAATAEEIKHFLNARPEVTYWVTMVPKVYFIGSDENVTTLSELFQDYMRKNGRPIDETSGGRYAFLEFTSSHGWLNKVVWSAIDEVDSSRPAALSDLFKRYLEKPPQ